MVIQKSLCLCESCEKASYSVFQRSSDSGKQGGEQTVKEVVEGKKNI